MSPTRLSLVKRWWPQTADERDAPPVLSLGIFPQRNTAFRQRVPCRSCLWAGTWHMRNSALVRRQANSTHHRNPAPVRLGSPRTKASLLRPCLPVFLLLAATKVPILLVFVLCVGRCGRAAAVAARGERGRGRGRGSCRILSATTAQ